MVASVNPSSRPADLAELGRGRSTIYEWSVRVTPDDCWEREKRVLWIQREKNQSPFDLGGAVKHLEENCWPRDFVGAVLKNPDNILALGISMDRFGQGLGVVYLHRDHPDPTQKYRAYQWNPTGSFERFERTVTYQSWFFPETPHGLRPQDHVHPDLKVLFIDLARMKRVRRLSTFWLRTQDDKIDQVCLTFSWMPRLEEILASYSPHIGTSVIEKLKRWNNRRVRHIAFSGDCRKPEMNIYFSGEINAIGLGDGKLICQQAGKNADRAATIIDALIFSRIRDADLASERPDLCSFYEPDDLNIWKRVLGPELHYHHGEFQQGERIDIWDDRPFHRSVERVSDLIDPGERVYDLGCGWGGVGRYLMRNKSCRVLGLTACRAQYRYCFEQGMNVRLGDMERTLPPGMFDTALLMESLEHVFDKATLLHNLRQFCSKVVMRVNCQDQGDDPRRFEGTMMMISSDCLRTLIKNAGWRIRRWKNIRESTLNSVKIWHNRLDQIPKTQDRHLEALRNHCRRTRSMLEQWGACNPLIEVVIE